MKRDHHVGIPEHAASGFNGHKLGALSEKTVHGKMIQEMQNCLLLCWNYIIRVGLVLRKWEQMVLWISLLLQSYKWLRNCKRSCICWGLETGMEASMGTESKAVLACGVKVQHEEKGTFYCKALHVPILTGHAALQLKPPRSQFKCIVN